MSLKSWVLHRVHDMNGIAGRNDLPPREPDFQPTRPAPEPVGARIEGVLRAPSYTLAADYCSAKDLTPRWIGKAPAESGVLFQCY